MGTRARIGAFGSAAALVAAGVAVVALVGGVTGEAIATGLIAFGLIALVSLVFLEVGLSEDRDRAREQARRAQPGPARPPRRPLRPWAHRFPRRPQ